MYSRRWEDDGQDNPSLFCFCSSESHLSLQSKSSQQPSQSLLRQTSSISTSIEQKIEIQTENFFFVYLSSENKMSSNKFSNLEVTKRLIYSNKSYIEKHNELLIETDSLLIDYTKHLHKPPITFVIRRDSALLWDITQLLIPDTLSLPQHYSTIPCLNTYMGRDSRSTSSQSLVHTTTHPSLVHTTTHLSVVHTTTHPSLVHTTAHLSLVHTTTHTNGNDVFTFHQPKETTHQENNIFLPITPNRLPLFRIEWRELTASNVNDSLHVSPIKLTHCRGLQQEYEIVRKNCNVLSDSYDKNPIHFLVNCLSSKRGLVNVPCFYLNNFHCDSQSSTVNNGQVLDFELEWIFAVCLSQTLLIAVHCLTLKISWCMMICMELFNTEKCDPNSTESGTVGCDSSQGSRESSQGGCESSEGGCDSSECGCDTFNKQYTTKSYEASVRSGFKPLSSTPTEPKSLHTCKSKSNFQSSGASSSNIFKVILLLFCCFLTSIHAQRE